MKTLKITFLGILILMMSSCLAADEDPVSVPPITGETLEPNMGGARQGNQVWVDLSEAKDKSMTSNLRTDWDLAFYSGDEFRVLLNGSIVMAAGEIANATDIDAITSAQVSALKKKVTVGSFDVTNLQYVDDPTGNFLTQTSGIAAVSNLEAENPIYLVNMGLDVYSGDLAPGTFIAGENSRGWMLLQVQRATEGYKVKYKVLGSTAPHSEYTITKKTDYAFTFFSLKAGKEVAVQPKRKNWDIGFTVFTNEVFYTSGEPAGSYIFGDFVVTNIVDGVGAYPVTVPPSTSADLYYSNFSLADVDAAKFIFNDQRAIGDKWRTTTENNGPHVYGNVFFVIRDADGVLFKLKFNKMMDNGERGHPQFEYEPL